MSPKSLTGDIPPNNCRLRQGQDQIKMSRSPSSTPQVLYARPTLEPSCRARQIVEERCTFGQAWLNPHRKEGVIGFSRRMRFRARVRGKGNLYQPFEQSNTEQLIKANLQLGVTS
jgi:hypothetical protein